MRKDSRKVVSWLLILLLLFPYVPSVSAASNGTADGTYDFGGTLGPDNSGGSGFATLSDKFVVSNGFVAEGTQLWSAGQQVPNTTGTLDIKAEGTTVCKTFTFKDLGISSFELSAFNLSFLSVELRDVNNVLVATLTNTGIVNLTNNTSQLSTLLNGGSQYNYKNISHITIKWKFIDTSAPSNLNFDNITIADVSANVAPDDTNSPTVGNNGMITTSNIAASGLTLDWDKATDDVTAPSDLEYRIYQSTSNNIDNVNNMETNGIALGNDFTKDISTFDVAGLSPNTTYYFNVIVKDAAGNKSAYQMQQVKTSPSLLNSADASFTIKSETTGNKIRIMSAVGLPSGNLALSRREMNASNVTQENYIDIYNPSGTKVKSINITSLLTPRTNDKSDNVNLLALKNGNILVQWDSGSAGKGFDDAYFFIMNEVGQIIKSATKLHNEEKGLDRFVRVAQLSNGDIAFVWTTGGYVPSGSSTTDYALRVFDEHGNPKINQFSLPTLGENGPRESVYTHEIVANSTGTFMIVYDANLSQNYMGILFNNDGTPKTVNGNVHFPISDVYKSGSAQKKVESLSNGNFVVSFKGEPVVNVVSRDARVAVFQPDGTKLSETILKVIGNTAIPTLVSLADGGYVLADFHATNTQGAYRANRYDNNGNLLEESKQISDTGLTAPLLVAGFHKGLATIGHKNSLTEVAVRLYGFPSVPTDTEPPSITNKTIRSLYDVTTSGVKLDWDKASDTVTTQRDLEYRVYQSMSNNIDTISNIEANGTALGSGFTKDMNTFDVSGLSPNTTYYFNVIVKDAAGNKSVYTMKEVTTAEQETSPALPFTQTFDLVNAGTESELNQPLILDGVVYSTDAAGEVLHVDTVANSGNTIGSGNTLNVIWNGKNTGTYFQLASEDLSNNFKITSLELDVWDHEAAFSEVYTVTGYENGVPKASVTVNFKTPKGQPVSYFDNSNNLKYELSWTRNNDATGDFTGGKLTFKGSQWSNLDSVRFTVADESYNTNFGLTNNILGAILDNIVFELPVVEELPSSNANLSNLVLSSGSLNPSFAAETEQYSVNVGNNVTSIKVTPTIADANATVTVNDVSVVSGNASSDISLNVGNNSILVKVTAENGSIKLYTITITRAAPTIASSPSVTDATTAEDTQSSSGLVIMPNVQDDAVTHFKISEITGGTLYHDDGATPINSGDFISMKDGGKGLKFTPFADANGPIGFSFRVQSAFDANGKGLSESATAQIIVTEVNDTPIATDDQLPAMVENTPSQIIPFADLLANDSAGPANESGQDLTITAVDQAIGGIVLLEGTNVIFIPEENFVGEASFLYTVTDNGTTNGGADPRSAQATVSININKAPKSTNANLSNLTTSAGPLTPVFDADTLNYSTSVPNTVSNITVTPTLEDTGATVTVNGSPALLPVYLNVGDNTISLVVTAEDGVTTKSYTVTVTRANPQYNVGFDSNGGSAVASQTIVHGEKASVPTPPTKANHTFGGWYTSNIFDTTFDFENAITTDTTLYAKWIPVTYTVSFDTDGGSAVANQTVVHGEKASVPDAPTKANYTFDGWYTSNTFDTTFNFDSEITTDTTLYAKWTPVTYTVSFDVDGGSAVAPQTVTHGEKASEPSAPTKANHIFAGWYTSNTFDTTFDFDNGIITDTTLYARWTPVTYTVSFDVDGGTVIAPQTVTHEGKASEPTVPTKANHIFAGWYTSDEFTAAFDFDHEITSDTTIYAKWTPVTYTVSFDVAGGSAVADQTVAHGEKAIVPTAPTKANHTFGGWYTGNTFDTTFNFDSEITTDTTLYAKWTPVTYTVSFEVDGGSAVADQTVAYGEKASIPTPPTKANHTFGGWYTSDTLSTEFDFNSEITANTTIYAKWTPVTYTVSFDADGGSAVANQTVAHGEKASVPAAPTKANHTFGGWYTSNTFDTTFDFDNGIITDTTLYAKWTPVTYTVNFDVVGGSVVASQTVMHGDKASEPTAPTKANHTFAGWYTSDEYTTAFDFDREITSDTMIYVKWNVITNPPPANNGGGGSSTPPSNTEQIVVDVDGNDGSNLTKTPITRTTEPNGTVKDKVSMSEDIAKDIVGKAKEKGMDTARIIIPDKDDKVSEILVEIPKTALKQLNDGKMKLEIATENAVISIPTQSIADFKDDLYFRVVPIKSETEKKKVEDRAKTEELVKEVAKDQTVQVLGRPMEIETNMQSREVSITLPLKDSLPTDAAKQQEILNNLGVFIEHSDGTKELIPGKVAKMQDGTQGLLFTVTKFSTFTMVYMDGWDEYQASQKVLHTPYINGVGNGKFAPTADVTRAEMAAMLARNLDKAPTTNLTAYKDVSSKYWANTEIMEAKNAGIMLGVSTINFDPEGSVTRSQMAVIAYRWIQQECKNNTAAFESCGKLGNITKANYKDVPANHWAVDAINFLKATHIMVGNGNGDFRPEERLTRAEAVKVLNRLFKRGPLTGVETPTFKDVSTSHWAFEEIEEAAREHKFSANTDGKEVLNK